LRGGIPNKIVLTVSTPNFWAEYTIGFIERLLRATQKVLGSHMRLSQKWFQIASGAAFEVIVASCFKRRLL